MEQTEGYGNKGKSIGKSVYSYIQLGSFASFAVLLAYSSLLAFGTGIQNYVYLLVALAAIAYSLGFMLFKTMLVSLSWVVLGIILLTAWIVSDLVSVPSVLIWAAVLLAGYEFNRFSNVTRKANRETSSLDEQSLAKYEQVIRHHASDTTLIVLASLVFSVAVASLSENLLIIFNPPVLGTVIFAFLAVLVVAILALRANH